MQEIIRAADIIHGFDSWCQPYVFRWMTTVSHDGVFAQQDTQPQNWRTSSGGVKRGWALRRPSGETGKQKTTNPQVLFSYHTIRHSFVCVLCVRGFVETNQTKTRKKDYNWENGFHFNYFCRTFFFVSFRRRKKKEKRKRSLSYTFSVTRPVIRTQRSVEMVFLGKSYNIFHIPRSNDYGMYFLPVYFFFFFPVSNTILPLPTQANKELDALFFLLCLI